jgi:MFS family permease
LDRFSIPSRYCELNSTWAKFSDIFGRKPILLIANVVSFAGTIACAVSGNIGMLIAARGVQGIGGGGLSTLVSVSIADLFSMRYARYSPLESIEPNL